MGVKKGVVMVDGVRVIPRALPSDQVIVKGVGRALKTASKYVATGWYHLVAGEKFEAPYEVLKQLRRAGFAE